MITTCYFTISKLRMYIRRVHKRKTTQFSVVIFMDVDMIFKPNIMSLNANG